jgi:signal transduction histidine kinase/CheY-like chemotaxis protein
MSLDDFLAAKLNRIKIYLKWLGKYYLHQTTWFITLLFITFSFILLYISAHTILADTTDTKLILRLEDTQGEYPLGHYLSILEDKDKKLSIQEVSSKEWAEKFVKNKISAPSLGLSSSAYWIKFTINNKSSSQKDWLLEIDFPRINKVSLFEPTNNPNSKEPLFTEKLSGSFTPFNKREFKHHSLIFPINVYSNEEKTFFIRIESISTISIPATVWSKQSFQEKDQIRLLLLGVYYGILLVLMPYDILMYFATKDRIFLIDLTRVIVLTVLQLSFDGFAAQYLWPNSTSLTNHSIQIFSTLFGASIVLLSRDYLNLKEFSPLWDKIAKTLVIILLLITVIPIFAYTRFVSIFINFFGLFIIIALVISTALSLRKDYSPAKYFLISILISFLGGAVTLMRNVNLIDNNFFIQYSLHFGSAFQVIVLSVGLAERVRLLLKSKEDAELLATLKEKDSEIFKLRNVELTEANLKLKEVNQIKANFTAMLVHDLKSPLTVVKSTLELLAGDKTLQKDNQQMISASERSIKKILNLVSEVLEVYRSESKEMPLELKTVDVESFLRDFTLNTRLAAKVNNISVDVQITLPLPQLIGDINQLERVFSNLVSNALKFTSSGGKITIEVTPIVGTGVESGLTFLRFSITDTGEGIPAEEIPYLFEPYRQANSRKKSAGVGLGLAIVKRIVASHGGNISVRSQIGVGSCFTVILPVISVTQEIKSNQKLLATFTRSGKVVPYEKIDSHQIEQAIHDDTTSKNAPPLILSEPSTESPFLDPKNQPTILLVDDDKMNQMIVKKQLQQLGYNVDVAANGVAALRAIKAKSYNLILMDCNMPVMDGYEATLKIRKDEAEQREKSSNIFRIPIIALTANSLSDSERCFEVGMDDFLEKPFELSQIKNILEKWLTKD